MMWRNMADSLRTCGLFGKAEVQGGGRRFAFLAVHGRESLEACRLARGFQPAKNGAALHWAAPFLSIHISRLQRFAFQTLHPVVSREKRAFSVYFEPGGVCRRLASRLFPRQTLYLAFLSVSCMTSIMRASGFFLQAARKASSVF